MGCGFTKCATKTCTVSKKACQLYKHTDGKLYCSTCYNNILNGKATPTNTPTQEPSSGSNAVQMQ